MAIPPTKKAYFLRCEEDPFFLLDDTFGVKEPEKEEGSAWFSMLDNFPSDSSATPSPQKTAQKVSGFSPRSDEGRFSPPSSPFKAPKERSAKYTSSSLMTPEKVKTLKRKFRDEFDPEADFLPQEKSDIESGLSTLELVSSPTKRSRHARETHHIAVGRASEGAEGIVEQHDRLVETSKGNPDFGKYLSRLRFIDDSSSNPSEEFPKPIIPVNYKHIMEPDIRGPKAVGWHFCSPEQYATLKDIIHAPSGVFSATFSIEGSWNKNSTFFPFSIPSIEVLDRLIQSSRIVAEEEVRTLRLIPEHDIYFEAIKKNGCIHTAYPLLFLGTWKEGEEFPIFEGKRSLSSDQVLTAAQKVMSEYANAGPISILQNPIRYYSNDGSKIYLEIGPAFEHIGVRQGIWFVFERKLFVEDEDQSDK